MTDKRFTHYVAMITGAGSGIGAACALRFAQEGANVACLDLREARNEATAAQCREQGVEAIALNCNVTSEESINAVVAAILQKWGHIDILVAAAGIYSGAPLAVKVVAPHAQAQSIAVSVELKAATPSSFPMLPSMSIVAVLDPHLCPSAIPDRPFAAAHGVPRATGAAGR